MPNIVLLIPIADVLGVTVTELLRGERIDTQKGLDTQEVDELVESFDLSVINTINQHKKNWIVTYLLCLFISIVEIIVLVLSGVSLVDMKEDILLITHLMLIFSGWFCFFAKDLLPTYYDGNKINYVSEGVFRIHMIGLSFNNGNWPYICTTFKIWLLAIAVIYPLVSVLVINLINILLWNEIKNIFVWIAMIGMIISVYVVGKKYE